MDNIYLICNILNISSRLGLNAGLISLNQEKAFDRVKHCFVWKAMKRFRFCINFIAKIQALDREIDCTPKFNSSLSEHSKMLAVCSDM